MRITVCQLHNDRGAFVADWDRLVDHVKAQRSELVLLPEMPFFTWFPTPRAFDAGVWRAAVAAHDTWERRLSELMPAVALGTRPVDFGALRYSAGFAWNEAEGIAETIHVKCCLTNEDDFSEATWYQRAAPDFESATVGAARIGMLIGLELWMPEGPATYGQDKVHIIAIPRLDRSANEDDCAAANEEWLAGGRAAALGSGVFCMSSARGGGANVFCGSGWVLGPDGSTLAQTTSAAPFVTVEVDLGRVRAARAQ